MIHLLYRGGRVSVLPEIKQLNTMEQDDIDRYDDGAIYPELTEEEKLALEDNEFTTQPQMKVLRDDMESITTEADKLKDLLSK